jgi:hypothetical protein
VSGLGLAALRNQVQVANAIRESVYLDQLIDFDEYDDALSAVLDGRAGSHASADLAGFIEAVLRPAAH